MIVLDQHELDTEALAGAGVTIFGGDCRPVLRQLAADGTRVHAIVTSPPYPNGIRAYDIAPVVWGGREDCAHVWGEPLRSPWANSLPGPSANAGKQPLAHGAPPASCGCCCEQCGAWLGVLGQEPRVDCRRAWAQDRCNACYVCHLLDVLRLCRAVLRKDGVCWLNIGDTFTASRLRQAPPPDADDAPAFKPKDCILVASMVALAAQADGWWLRAPLIPWIKPNPLPGPWTDRPIVGHEWWLMLTPAPEYWYDHTAVRQPFADARQGADGSTAGRVRGWGGRPDEIGKPNGIDPSANGGRNFRTTDPWYAERRRLAAELRDLADMLMFHERDGDLLSDPDGLPLALECGVGGNAGQGVHAAAFPARLIRPLIRSSVPPLVCERCGAPWERAGQEVREIDASVGQYAARGAGQDRDARGPACRPDRVWTRIIGRTDTGWERACDCDPDQAGAAPGMVLDPFAGVLTTLVVAVQEGRRAIGIEAGEAYLAAGRERLHTIGLPQQEREERWSRRRRPTRVAQAGATGPIWTWRHRQKDTGNDY